MRPQATEYQIGFPPRIPNPDELNLRYDLLKKESRDIILFVNQEDGRILEANEAAVQAYGYSYEELRAMPVSDLRTPLDRHLVAGQMALARAGGVSFVTEHRRRDGSTFFVEVSSKGAAIDGRSILISIIRDITERKKAEEALRQSEDKFSRLFHESPGFLCITDIKTGRYLMVNKAYCELTGYPAEEIIGRTSLELGFVTEAERAEMIKALEAVGSTNTSESRIRTKNGEIRTRMLSAAVIEIQGKRAIISSGVDITERKQAEQAIKQMNESLEQRVAERTALARTRANQLQALAVELIEAEEREKRRIAELIHDDLQQVLAAARLQLEAVCEELPRAPKLPDIVGMLSDSISKARQLSHELSPAVLHHLGLLAALRGLCQQMDERFGLTVQLQADAAEQFENMPLKSFVFRAIQELLFNIAKHAGVKEAAVALSRSANEMAVTVSDKGRGFDPTVLDSLPEKVGLGLLSLRERASYVGGCLSVESTPGKGSRFTLTLPLDLPPAEVLQQVEPHAPFTPSRVSMACDSGGIRVLFADDHKVMRQGLIQLTAGQPDIRIVGEATNGREAVELAHRLRPDVIVMDISMPEMDGIEATRRIRAELPGVRVIGLSMFEDEHTARAMRDAGAEAFVSKSASSSEVLKAIYAVARVH